MIICNPASILPSFNEIGLVGYCKKNLSDNVKQIKKDRHIQQAIFGMKDEKNRTILMASTDANNLETTFTYKPL